MLISDGTPPENIPGLKPEAAQKRTTENHQDLKERIAKKFSRFRVPPWRRLLKNNKEAVVHGVRTEERAGGMRKIFPAVFFPSLSMVGLHSPALAVEVRRSAFETPFQK